jgi:hypothetical protein
MRQHGSTFEATRGAVMRLFPSCMPEPPTMPIKIKVPARVYMTIKDSVISLFYSGRILVVRILTVLTVACRVS